MDSSLLTSTPLSPWLKKKETADDLDVSMETASPITPPEKAVAQIPNPTTRTPRASSRSSAPYKDLVLEAIEKAVEKIPNPTTRTPRHSSRSPRNKRMSASEYRDRFLIW